MPVLHLTWRAFSRVGAGVHLLTQYTVCAEVGFDCAVRDMLGGERPAWRVWCLPFHRIGPA